MQQLYWVMLASVVIADPCLPYYVSIRRTTLTLKARSRTAWPSINNDAVVCRPQHPLI